VKRFVIEMSESQIRDMRREYREDSFHEDNREEKKMTDAEVFEAILLADVTSVREVAESPEGR